MTTPYKRCQATRNDGFRCWAPAMSDQRIQGLILCWIHTAKIIMIAEKLQQTDRHQAASSYGIIQSFPAEDIRRVK